MLHRKSVLLLEGNYFYHFKDDISFQSFKTLLIAPFIIYVHFEWILDPLTDRAFLYKSKLCGYKIGTQFKKSVQNTTNYATKILNVYIAYDLDNWPRSPLYNFALKYCLFGATVIVRNSDKSKYLYIDYRIAFNGAGSWSFDNQFVRNALIFGADNSSSSHIYKFFFFFKS